MEQIDASKITIRLTRQENLAHFNVAKGAAVTLDLEREYLPVVVASEVYENNSRTPIEAKKAQAIAARTYVIAHTRTGTVIDDTANYQAYKWRNISEIPNSLQAVLDTAGQILMYQGGLITAWYSNSNGGRTKRSDEAWSSYKPWTEAKDDHWDTAARAKWGECKASHGVGLSQMGAAYAASIGVAYTEILRFYYASTDIVAGYGESGVIGQKADERGMPMEKTNIGLAEFARQWIGMPYWYGTCCYKCTTSLLSSKAAQYPTHYTDARMPKYRADVSAGKSCADCVGLIKGYHWWDEALGATKKTADFPDVNTTGFFNATKIKGEIKKTTEGIGYTIPEVPGLVVYKNGHVGVYDGDGYVIEAKGFAHGIVRTHLKDTPWTHWLADPWISYEGYEEALGMAKPEKIKFPCAATVQTRTDPLNIWSDTRKTKSLAQVQKGATLHVYGLSATSGWYDVEKDGARGFADGQYLSLYNVKIEEIPEGVVDDITNAEFPAEPKPYLYRAKVINVTKSLNFRIHPSLAENNTIAWLKKDTVVEVLAERQGKDQSFALVRYNGEEGYCTRSYLYQVDG